MWCCSTLGDMIDARTAHEIGMANRVVPLAELPEATMKFARHMALIAPESLARAACSSA